MKIVKNKKIIVGIVAVALLAVGGIAYVTNQSKKQVAQEQTMYDKEAEALNILKKEIEELLDGDYLVSDVTTEKITHETKQYEEIMSIIGLNIKETKADASAFRQANNDCKKVLDQVETMFQTQESVNRLFQDKDKVAMNGSIITNELAIVNELENDTIQELKATLPEEATTAFDKSVAELVKQAEEQVKQIEKATDAVAKVYKDDKVISKDSKTYEIAKNEVEKIKNEKAKKALSEKLAKVKEALEKEEEKTTETTNADQAGTAESNGVSPTTENNNGTTYTPVNDGDGSGSYTHPASDGGGNGSYTPPANEGGNGGYTPPANDTIINGDEIQGSADNNYGGWDEWGGL